MSTNARLFIKTYNNKKVYYDPRFQRRYGTWTLAMKRKFIHSLNRGWVCQNIIVVNIEKCLDDEEVQADPQSVSYYKDLLNRGFKYISLDGQHRTKVILEFFEDGFTLIADDYVDADGAIVTGGNKVFSKLAPRLKDQLKRLAHISVYELDAVRSGELSTIFLPQNPQKPLTAQQRRQALTTPVAAWVQNVAKDMQTVMSWFFKDDQIRDAYHDEAIAKMTMVLIRHYRSESIPTLWSLSEADIDAWYKVGDTYHEMEDEGCDYSVTEFDRAKRILALWTRAMVEPFNYGEKSRGKMPKHLIWPLLWACEYVEDAGKEIQDQRAFSKEVQFVHNTLSKESEAAWTVLANEAYQSADPDRRPPAKEPYYFKQKGIPHRHLSREMQKATFVAEFSKRSHLREATVRTSRQLNAGLAAK